ncbi:TetR/AcrR family transcriptional regulator [Streptomyces sp. NPDC048201]|uniref:TetR/AcrR family transcriptional regulator n=1 Tax=Streptomyces sp. NPDC048201 TaxID=3365513 RepID=UPI003721FDF3
MTPRPGLRERKKARTRGLLRQEALRLFTEQGCDRTTVEQICAAADVSPSTFFRYFPVKEDAVLPDDTPPFPPYAGLPQPPEQAIRETLTALIAHHTGGDPAAALPRLILIARTPSLRSRLWQRQEPLVSPTATDLAHRTHRSDPHPLRPTAAALTALTTETVLHWAETGGTEPLKTLTGQAAARLGGMGL